MYRLHRSRPDGPFGLLVLTAPTRKEEGSGPGGPLPSLTGGRSDRDGRGLAQRVADGVELGAGLATQGAQGDDADHGDEGQEERVLHQGGATLGVAEAGTDVRAEGSGSVHDVPSQDWS